MWLTTVTQYHILLIGVQVGFYYFGVVDYAAMNISVQVLMHMCFQSSWMNNMYIYYVYISMYIYMYVYIIYIYISRCTLCIYNMYIFLGNLVTFKILRTFFKVVKPFLFPPEVYKVCKFTISSLLILIIFFMIVILVIWNAISWFWFFSHGSLINFFLCYLPLCIIF